MSKADVASSLSDPIDLKALDERAVKVLESGDRQETTVFMQDTGMAPVSFHERYASDSADDLLNDVTCHQGVKSIPRSIRYSIHFAWMTLDGEYSALRGVRAARGDGHHLSLELRDRAPVIAEQLKKLDEIRGLAEKNGLLKAFEWEVTRLKIPDFLRYGLEAAVIPEWIRSPALVHLSKQLDEVSFGGYNQPTLQHARHVLKQLPPSTQVAEGLATLDNANKGAQYSHTALQSIAIGLRSLAQGLPYEGDQALIKHADVPANEAWTAASVKAKPRVLPEFPASTPQSVEDALRARIAVLTKMVHDRDESLSGLVYQVGGSSGKPRWLSSPDYHDDVTSCVADVYLAPKSFTDLIWDVRGALDLATSDEGMIARYQARNALEVIEDFTSGSLSAAERAVLAALRQTLDDVLEEDQEISPVPILAMLDSAIYAPNEPAAEQVINAIKDNDDDSPSP